MPTVTFATINDLITYVNNYIKENHMEEITGPIHNNVENGIIDYVKKATYNFFKADIVSSGGDVVLDRNITVIMGVTPTSLFWGDNFSNEWTVVNMTGEVVFDGLVYYDPSGNAIDRIPANTILHIGKADNDLWVQLDGGNGGGGGGSTQKQPKTYFVGATAGAPVAGTNTWTNGLFANSYVTIVLARSIDIDLEDDGTGTNIWVDKTLSSDTLTINNYTWQTGDILTVTLITP